MTCGDDGEVSDIDEEVSDIMDMSCFQESQDAESCPSSVDADGSACVWCSAAGFGVCLNADQSDAAKPYMTCGDDEVSDVDEEVSDIMDMSCFQESQDAESCPSSVDADGSACVWCSAAGFGVCLNADQSDAAKPYMTCGDDAASVEKKFTTLMATESH
eukprot:scaffold5564_cov61-Attheya_sp.AAC.1